MQVIKEWTTCHLDGCATLSFYNDWDGEGFRGTIDAPQSLSIGSWGFLTTDPNFSIVLSELPDYWQEFHLNNYSFSVHMYLPDNNSSFLVSGERWGDIPFVGTWTGDFNNVSFDWNPISSFTLLESQPLILTPEPSISLMLVFGLLFIAGILRRRRNGAQ